MATATGARLPPQNPPRCPRCGSANVERLYREGPIDFLLFLFGRFPFSCSDCFAKFYLRQRTT